MTTDTVLDEKEDEEVVSVQEEIDDEDDFDFDSIFGEEDNDRFVPAIPAYDTKRKWKLYILYKTKYVNLYQQMRLSEKLKMPLAKMTKRLKNLPCRLEFDYDDSEVREIQHILFKDYGIVAGFDDADLEFLYNDNLTTKKKSEEAAMQIIGIIASLDFATTKEIAAEQAYKIKQAAQEGSNVKNIAILDTVYKEFNDCTDKEYEELRKVYKEIK